MIKRQALSYGADQQFITHPMCQALPPPDISLDVEIAIAVCAHDSTPEPTSLSALELALESDTRVSGPRPPIASHVADYTTVYTGHIGGFLGLRRLGWQLDRLADEVEAGMWPDVNDPRAVAEDWMGQ